MSRYRRGMLFMGSVVLIIAGLLIARDTSAAGVGSDESSQQTVQTKCTGKIVNIAGKPIDGVRVKLYVLSAGSTLTSFQTKLIKDVITKADGEFALNIKIDESEVYRIGMIVAEKENLAVGWANWDLKEDKEGLEIKLAEPKELSGVVVDVNDKPISDAQVGIFIIFRGEETNPQYLTSYGRTDFFTVRTDSEGKFVFKNIPADAKAELMVKKTGRANVNTWSGGSAPKLFPGQTDIKIVQPVEAKIEGRLLQKDSGKPVAGVEIMIRQSGQDTSFLWIEPVISKEDGSFVFAELPASKYVLTLVSQKEGLTNWTAEPVEVETEAGLTKKDVKIEVSKGGIAEVAVTDEVTKRPVEKVSVIIQRGGNERTLSGTTDEEGLARFRVMPGEYSLVGIYKEGYSRQIQAETIVVEDGKTARLEVQIAGQPKITGVIKDLSGKQMEGVKISILPGNPREITSDAAGKFELNWDLRAWGQEERMHLLVARDEKHNLASAIEINEDAKDLDIKLKPGITFTGRIVDPNDKPIEKAELMVYMKVGNYSSSISRERYKTDSAGKFQINAIPEDNIYYIHAMAENYGKSQVNADISGVQDSKLNLGDIKLNVANLTVSGIVVDINDQPVADARIFAYGAGQPENRDIRTGKDGKFIIPKVCAGSIQLSVNARGLLQNLYGYAEVEGGAKDIKIVVGESGSSNIYVPRKPPSLAGKALPELKDSIAGLSYFDANDKIILICFFDMQQRPGRYMVNELIKQADVLKGRSVTVITVQAAKVDENTLSEWAKKINLPFPVGKIVGDEEKTKFSWGIQSLPWLILTDKEHIIRYEGFALAELDEKIKAVTTQ